jgi:hypothetical protein
MDTDDEIEVDNNMIVNNIDDNDNILIDIRNSYHLMNDYYDNQNRQSGQRALNIVWNVISKIQHLAYDDEISLNTMSDEENDDDSLNGGKSKKNKTKKRIYKK